jgi:hypothetical protein
MQPSTKLVISEFVCVSIASTDGTRIYDITTDFHESPTEVFKTKPEMFYGNHYFPNYYCFSLIESEYVDWLLPSCFFDLAYRAFLMSDTNVSCCDTVFHEEKQANWDDVFYFPYDLPQKRFIDVCCSSGSNKSFTKEMINVMKPSVFAASDQSAFAAEIFQSVDDRRVPMQSDDDWNFEAIMIDSMQGQFCSNVACDVSKQRKCALSDISGGVGNPNFKKA